jgi:hypothetical protein
MWTAVDNPLRFPNPVDNPESGPDASGRQRTPVEFADSTGYVGSGGARPLSRRGGTRAYMDAERMTAARSPEPLERLNATSEAELIVGYGGRPR